MTMPSLKLSFFKRLLCTPTLGLVFFFSTSSVSFAEKIYFSLIRFESPLGDVLAEILVEGEEGDASHPFRLIWKSNQDLFAMDISSGRVFAPKEYGKMIQRLAKKHSDYISKNETLPTDIHKNLFQTTVEPTYWFAKPVEPVVEVIPSLNHNLKTSWTKTAIFAGDSVASLSLFWSIVGRVPGLIHAYSLNHISLTRAWVEGTAGVLMVGFLLTQNFLMWAATHSSFPDYSISEVWKERRVLKKIWNDFWKSTKKENFLNSNSGALLDKALLSNQIAVSGKPPLQPIDLQRTQDLPQSLTVRVESVPTRAHIERFFTDFLLRIESAHCAEFVLDETLDI